MGAKQVRANGLRFAYLEQGPVDGPLALCLHGFPDHAGTWRHLLPRLADAGFHAVAPWLRGYPPTEVPGEHPAHAGTATRVGPEVLAADVNALHRALGGTPRAVVIGHDWGAIAAMRAAAAAPDRWRRVVSLAVPPERALARVPRDPAQLWRSRYMLAAITPGAARRFANDDGAALVELWRAWSPGYEPTEADLTPLRAAIASPGAMDAMLAYYRGFVPPALRGEVIGARAPLPPQPHLMLHGADDGCIDAGYARRAASLLRHHASRVEVVDDVGHFLHLESPELVDEHIVTFVAP